MTMQPHNMQTVEKFGDLLPEGWYHFRVSKVEEKSSETGNPVVWLHLKAQTEPYVGRTMVDMPSLQPHALQKLKAYYEAVGYKPGPEGHDPERLLDTELFAKVEHDVYQGEKRPKIAPYNIRSLAEGPKGALAK